MRGMHSDVGEPPGPVPQGSPSGSGGWIPCRFPQYNPRHDRRRRADNSEPDNGNTLESGGDQGRGVADSETDRIIAWASSGRIGNSEGLEVINSKNASLPSCRANSSGCGRRCVSGTPDRNAPAR